MNLKLAWRNIWRNKRRTIITTASIFTAVLLAMMMRSVQLGVYERMISNMVRIYTGHIQIHKKGYADEQSIDKSFEENDTLASILNQTKSVSHWSARLESFALASANDLTQGVMVVGIHPLDEDNLTNLSGRIKQGKYLSPGDSGIILGEGIAENLQLHVNDTVVLLGQGYHGASAAGKYPVRGILHLPIPQLNQSMTYISLPQARTLYQTGNRLTSIAALLKNDQDAAKAAKHLQKKISSSQYEVIDWKTMLPELLQLIAGDNMFGIIIIIILYMIIGFGIFGTILMMLAERQHEFGILTAIGMKKTRLAKIVVLEILMLSTLGVVAGALAGIPIIGYFHAHPIPLTGEVAQTYAKFGMEPITPFSNSPIIFLIQGAVIYGISLLLCLYPWLRLMKIKTINALNN